MADDTNFRSYRQGDPRARERGPAAPAAAGRQGGSDPLAELARLIGQTDPFGDLSRKGAPAAAPRAPAHSTAEHAMARSPHHFHDPAAMPRAQDRYGAPSMPRHFDPPPFEGQAPIEPRHGGFQPAYDPAIYGNAPPAGGFGAQTHYDGAAQMPQGEDIYDDDFTETRPRRGLKTLMVLLGLALLGTGAAFGYRAFFVDGSTVPPVIKADNTPNKVAPASTSEASNKLIYDRVGDPAQGEKVASREEKPIDVQDATRSVPHFVFPGIPPSGDSTAGETSASLGGMPPGSAAAEPKKIRTVPIRPDQSLVDAVAPRTNATASPAASPRSSAPPPAPAPRSVAAPAAAPTTAPNNAPLSLSPQIASAEPPAPRAPAPTQIASVSGASVSGAAEAGAYAVQISSQRSEAEAQASFHNLQAKYPALLNDRQPMIRRADLGEKGIYFRAMVGPFASLDQATEFCGSLKAAGGQCVVQKN